MLAIVVNPVADFPLNDDWSYTRTVRTLVETHTLHFDDWGAPTLFTQVLYGALFCWTFGFSFTVLRVSALVAGLAGVMGVYVLLREIDVRRGTAFVGCLTLMLNPIYFLHSFMFMTDIPFTTLGIWSTAFFVRALRLDSYKAVMIATFLSCAATLVRQVGIAIPLGYAISLVLTSKLSTKTLVRAALPAVITIAVLMGYNACIAYLDIASEALGLKQREIGLRLEHDGLVAFIVRWLIMAVFLTLYAGLFTLPFSSALLSRTWRRCLSDRSHVAVTSAAGLAFIVYLARCFYRNRHMPFLGDTMNHAGLGAATMVNPRDWYKLAEGRLNYYWEMLTVGAGAGTLILVLLMSFAVIEIFRRRLPRDHFLIRVALFALFAAGIYMGPVAMVVVFDRYVLMLIPLGILLLGACAQLALTETHAPSFFWHFVVAVLLTAFGVFAVAGTHDFLSWNRARWQAVNELIYEQGIPPESIDGGFEVSGWFLFHRDEKMRAKWNDPTQMFVEPPPEGQPPALFFRLATPDYIVAFEPDEVSEFGESARIIARYPYRSWLLRREGTIVVLQMGDR